MSTVSFAVSFKDFESVMANLRRVSEGSPRYSGLCGKMCLIVEKTNKLIFIATNSYIYAEHHVPVQIYDFNNFKYNVKIYDTPIVIDIPPAIRLPSSSVVKIDIITNSEGHICEPIFTFYKGMTWKPELDKNNQTVFVNVRKQIDEMRKSPISFATDKECTYNSNYLKRLITGIDGDIYFETIPGLSYNPVIIRVRNSNGISSVLAILPRKILSDVYLQNHFDNNIHPIGTKINKRGVILNESD